MKKVILGLVLAILFSCDNPQDSPNTVAIENLSEEKIDSILSKFMFNYESAILVDSSRHVMIPISTNLLKRRGSYSSSNYSDDYPRYWNVLFYDRNTNLTHLLTEKKVRISNIYSGVDDSKNKNQMSFEGKILYVMGDQDFNGDGKLDFNDPTNLFSSSINGKDLDRISPKNESFQYFKVVPKSREIIIRTLRDTDKDMEFIDNKDSQIWYRAQLIDQEWVLTELIDSSGRNEIERLFFEQWLSNLEQ